MEHESQATHEHTLTLTRYDLLDLIRSQRGSRTKASRQTTLRRLNIPANASLELNENDDVVTVHWTETK